MNKLVYLFALMWGILLTSCNANEKDIVGVWQSSISNELYEQHVEAHFNADKTGKMLLYNGRELTANEFKWEIDGYLVKIEGITASVYEYNSDVTERPFTSTFRYKDGKLECEGVLPGTHIFLGQSSPTKLTLYKQ